MEIEPLAFVFFLKTLGLDGSGLGQGAGPELQVRRNPSSPTLQLGAHGLALFCTDDSSKRTHMNRRCELKYNGLIALPLRNAIGIPKATQNTSGSRGPQTR